MEQNPPSISSKAGGRGSSSASKHWYDGVTPYQWLILAIASAGWIFDIYEGQIFNLTRNQLLTDICGSSGGTANIRGLGDQLLGVFLAGGALGGLLFGMMADRWGRKRTMIVTILMYSVSAGMTYFAQSLSQVALLRFLVAMGVGGEWAVAASLVAEVFPATARAQASAIFHATSVFGTWLATLAGLAVGTNWRLAYMLGILPALLVIWVITSVREPESWRRTEAKVKSVGGQTGSLLELLKNPKWLKHSMLGMLLSAIGLGTFWAVTVAGQDLAREILLKTGAASQAAMKQSQFAYGIIQTIGGGAGLVAFGPLCVKIGRRKAFTAMALASVLIVPFTCYVPRNYNQLLCVLPIFGFFTLGMHAGFAVYFPELFPARLRATGAGFCFNAGRLLAAPVLFYSGWLKTRPGMDLRAAVSMLSLLFLLAMVVVYFMPETKDQPLPE